MTFEDFLSKSKLGHYPNRNFITSLKIFPSFRQIKSAFKKILIVNIAPNYDCQVKFP